MRILSVDDNPENLYLIEAIARAHRYEVVSASNGLEALEKLAVQSFDLIVSDILMPAMDGFQLCRTVKNDERLKQIPFIFYTATYTAKQDEELGLALGASRFIVKPIEPQEFLAIVEQVLREGESGNIPIPVIDIGDDEKNLRLYNERLVRKLERKMQQLEAARTDLVTSIEDKNREIAQRHLAEEALRKNEQRLVSIYNTVGDAIFHLVVEPEGQFRFVSVNAAFLRITGLSLEKVIGKTVKEVIPESSLTMVVGKYRKAVEEKTILLWEETSDYPAGRLTGEVRVAPVFDNTGTCTHLVGSVHDITDRKRAEKALRESEEWHRTILHTAMDGFWVADTQGHLLEVNESYCRMSGYSAEELLAMRISDLEAEETASETAGHIRSIISRGEHRFESRHRRKDGSTLHVEISAQYKPGEGGRMATFVRDLIERKRAEELLRQSGEQYQMLFNTLIEGFCVIEVAFDSDLRPIDYRFLELNPAFEMQTGIKDARGRLIRDLVPDLEPHWFEIYGQVALTGQPARFVNEAKALNRWYDVSAYRIGGPESRRVAILFNDITEARRAEQRLRDAQKLESLGVLAGGIAHDFNNMLGAILAQSELVLSEIPDGSPVAEGVNGITAVAVRAAEVVRQLLAYAGREDTSFELVDMSRLVSEMLQLLGVSISKRAVLKTDLAENLPYVRANASQMRRTVMNLITNASEALAEEGGVITVTTDRVSRDLGRTAESGTNLPDREYVRLEISDTGCGMSEEIQARIFDPFFTTKSTGRGLGLAAVQGIIRSHGGTIEVVSAPSRGTRIGVLLPCAGGRNLDEPAARPDFADKNPAARGTVLFVEDEEPLRTPLSKMLRKQGFSILEAGDGLTAVELFRAHQSRIGVVLLDLTLPGLSGKEVLAEVRRIRPGIKVILTTAYSQEMTAHALGGQHDWAFIRKPYTISDLAKLLRDVLSV